LEKEFAREIGERTRKGKAEDKLKNPPAEFITFTCLIFIFLFSRLFAGI
jgi:hypothetical protein